VPTPRVLLCPRLGFDVALEGCTCTALCPDAIAVLDKLLREHPSQAKTPNGSREEVPREPEK
jgi:hypothetical protein